MALPKRAYKLKFNREHDAQGARKSSTIKHIFVLAASAHPTHLELVDNELQELHDDARRQAHNSLAHQLLIREVQSLQNTKHQRKHEQKR